MTEQEKKSTEPRANSRQRVSHQRLKYKNGHEGLIASKIGFKGLHTLEIMGEYGKCDSWQGYFLRLNNPKE